MPLQRSFRIKSRVQVPLMTSWCNFVEIVLCGSQPFHPVLYTWLPFQSGNYTLVKYLFFAQIPFWDSDTKYSCPECPYTGSLEVGRSANEVLRSSTYFVLISNPNFSSYVCIFLFNRLFTCMVLTTYWRFWHICFQFLYFPIQFLANVLNLGKIYPTCLTCGLFRLISWPILWQEFCCLSLFSRISLFYWLHDPQITNLTFSVTAWRDTSKWWGEGGGLIGPPLYVGPRRWQTWHF